MHAPSFASSFLRRSKAGFYGFLRKALYKSLMLEKPLLAPGGRKPEPVNEMLALHEISWAELSCRFKAMQDYRRVTIRAGASSGGSFAPYAAVHMAQTQHGVDRVNPDGSILGKDNCPTLMDIEISR